MRVTEIIKEVEKIPARSTWAKAVKEDALWLLESTLMDGTVEFYFESPASLEERLLQGASSWREFSYGGGALIYDFDIAKHYCTPSELKRIKNGEKAPNKEESWLDVQARALFQAWRLIKENI